MSILINNWLKDKMPCNRCGCTEVSFYFNDAKIKRYAVRCKVCNNFIGWLLNRLVSEINKSPLFDK